MQTLTLSQAASAQVLSGNKYFMLRALFMVALLVANLPKGGKKVIVIVNVPPADDEQVAHVFKNRKTRKDMFKGWMTICS